MEDSDLLPNIDEYLNTTGTNSDCEPIGLENIVDEIIAKTNLQEFEAQKILNSFFQEIRFSMLQKEKVILNFGTFQIKGKIRMRPVFNISVKLKKELNGN